MTIGGSSWRGGVVTVERCRCRVGDWKALREALHLTQVQMAAHLGLTWRQVQRLEQRPHRCPRAQTILFLRLLLRQPMMVERLRRAGYRHPWPEDLA